MSLRVDIDEKRYNGTSVLESVSLDFEPGTHVAILGPSGCGKSTLLKILAGLDGQFNGALTLDGSRLRHGDDAVGIVFQEPILFPWLTVKQNISFARGLRLGRSIPFSRIEEVIRIVGLSDYQEAYPEELSGGMAQRVGLARAIVRHPRFLLLDEPFSGLDAGTRSRMQSWVLELAESEDITLILVTHDLEEAFSIGRRVILMALAPNCVSHEISLPRSYPRDPNSEDLRALLLNTRRMLMEDQPGDVDVLSFAVGANA